MATSPDPTAPPTAPPAGLLLAAGGGRRMGTPKALVADEHGPWLHARLDDLAAAGCAEVVVVLGARADDARALLAAHDAGVPVRAVVATDWASGMAASLRAGLAELAAGTPDAPAAVVMLVDLPDVTPAVLARTAAGAGPSTLRRAVFAGRPGHPVVLGREHWAGVMADVEGDAGARGYLREHHVEAVECGDLATGRDVDRPTPGTTAPPG